MQYLNLMGALFSRNAEQIRHIQLSQPCGADFDREGEIRDPRVAGTGADFDHIEDLLEMVLHLVAALGAGLLGFLDGGQEMPEIRVFEHTSQFACRPRFVAGLGDALDRLERAGCL